MNIAQPPSHGIVDLLSLLSKRCPTSRHTLGTSLPETTTVRDEVRKTITFEYNVYWAYNFNNIRFFTSSNDNHQPCYQEA